MGDLGITIAGVPLDHRLYHFRLAFSGFDTAMSSLAARASWPWPRVCRCAVDARGAPRSIAATACRPPSAIWTPRPRGFDPTLQGAVRPLRHGADPQQPRPGARERFDRELARPLEAGDRGYAAAARLARFDSWTLIAAASTRSSAGAMPQCLAVSISSARRLQTLPARRTTDYEEAIVTVTSTSGFSLQEGVLFGAVAADRPSAAGACVQRSARMLSRRHAVDDAAARAAASQRQTRPSRRLPAPHPRPAPQADGAPEPRPSLGQRLGCGLWVKRFAMACCLWRWRCEWSAAFARGR